MKPNLEAYPAAAAGAPRPAKARSDTIDEILGRLGEARAKKAKPLVKGWRPGDPAVPSIQEVIADDNRRRMDIRDKTDRRNAENDRRNAEWERKRFGGGPQPFFFQGGQLVPNPAFGKYHGMEWDGSSWVNLPPNADLEREAMEIQLEEMRRNARGNPDLRSWLQGRMERK